MTTACPGCGSPLPETVRFCESCGADLEGQADPAQPGARPAASGWELLIRSDRQYFERVEAEGVVFPSTEVHGTYPLTGDRIIVGRSRGGSEPVDLDLSGPPIDAGVSHVHASLLRGPDGAWAIVDCRSTNGTFLNDQDMPIPAGQPVALADGDQIHLGGWTSLTAAGSARVVTGASAAVQVENRPRRVAPEDPTMTSSLAGSSRQ
jgi:hypothetical protein